MNEAIEAEQKQIFEATLGSEDLEAINALVSKHKANAILTQQLALDASRLVATSQDRLAKQSDTGFFKRIKNAIDGTTSQNQMQNQMDVLQMQKFAWHYLQQLQQQNLINAQSIAVIRNNLSTINEYIIETRDFLEQAIDKIDHRLRQVENHTSLNTWALSIEANKRRLKSIPKTLLILRLTYDFIRSNQDVVMIRSDINNYLITTLEKLEINCDEEVQLLDFISELIDQIEVVGFDQFNGIITLSFDDHNVDSEYIQKNISGLGLNAIYFLSDQYEKIVDLIGDEQICNSDEAREKIISKFFGSEFSELSTTYSIRNLICEIIGGCQLAIDVYKDEYGLNTIQDEVTEDVPIEPVKLVSSFPDIHSHSCLDNLDSNQQKRTYLLLLALGVESSISLIGQPREFLTHLAERAGLPEMQQDISELADNPRKLIEYQTIMQEFLDDENKIYTWLLDIFFLLTLAGKAIESPQIKMILGVIKPAQLKERLPNVLTIIHETDAPKLLDAVLNLDTYTKGWKNIIQYREIRFDQCFAETIEQLNKARLNISRLNIEMVDISFKAMEHSIFVSFSDDGFLSKVTDKAAATICTQGRKSAISSLNEFSRKVSECISEYRFSLSSANRMIMRWNIPCFEPKEISLSTNIDLDNSIENESWGDQFQHYYQQTEDKLNSFSQACDDAIEQLELFSKGNFDESVLKRREQYHAERLRQREAEKFEKQFVTITKDGKEYFLGVEWQQVENPPCEPECISHIKTDGKIWLIMASINSDDMFYRSEDGLKWQQVQIDIPQFKVWPGQIYIENGVWIIHSRQLAEGTRDEGIYYSSDALNWNYCEAPGAAENSKKSLNQGCLTYENIISFNGMWLWKVTQQKKYNYIEKGFFSDSTKTDSFYKTILFSSATLEGPWQQWDPSPTPPEGVEVKKICAIPGKDSLLAFCEYENSYTRNKKIPNMPPFVMYYGAAKAWRNCTWDGSTNFHYSGNQPFIANFGNKLVCFSSGEILTSDKGYEWSKQEGTLQFNEYFPMKSFSIFTQNNNKAITLSQEIMIFKEMALDDGVWLHLTANEMGILSVYYMNRHEATILRFGRYICKAKT